MSIDTLFELCAIFFFWFFHRFIAFGFEFCGEFVILSLEVAVVGVAVVAVVVRFKLLLLLLFGAFLFWLLSFKSFLRLELPCDVVVDWFPVGSTPPVALLEFESEIDLFSPFESPPMAPIIVGGVEVGVTEAVDEIEMISSFLLWNSLSLPLLLVLLGLLLVLLLFSLSFTSSDVKFELLPFASISNASLPLFSLLAAFFAASLHLNKKEGGYRRNSCRLKLTSVHTRCSSPLAGPLLNLTDLIVDC